MNTNTLPKVRMLKTLALAASLFGVCDAKAALLLGDSIGVTYNYPDVNSVVDPGASFVVGPGSVSSSYTLSGITFDFSVTDDTIRISGFHRGSDPAGTIIGLSGPPATFNGLVFTDFSKAFPTFTLSSVTALPFFDSSRVGINGNALSLNMIGLQYTVGQSEIVLHAASVVPEPTTILAGALLLLPLGGSTLRAWRGRRLTRRQCDSVVKH